MGQQTLVHKLTEDLKGLAVRSRAVIPAHRTQLASKSVLSANTSPRAKKGGSLAKHEFATPKISQDPKSRLEKEQFTTRNATEAKELDHQSNANTGSK